MLNQLNINKINSRKSQNRVNYTREERKNLGAELKAFYEKSLCFTPKEIEHSGKQTFDILSKLFALLKEFDNRFSQAKLKRGIIDFNDIEHYTLKLLYDENGAVSDVAKELSSSLDEIYVDEYQDLNPLQNRIFEALSINCPIFMVGDIKQSIYGFRGAEPMLFASYRHNFPPLGSDEAESSDVATIFMSDNFRCDKNVIDFTNQVCSTIFSACAESIGYTREDDL